MKTYDESPPSKTPSTRGYRKKPTIIAVMTLLTALFGEAKVGSNLPVQTVAARAILVFRNLTFTGSGTAISNHGAVVYADRVQIHDNGVAVENIGENAEVHLSNSDLSHNGISIRNSSK